MSEFNPSEIMINGLQKAESNNAVNEYLRLIQNGIDRTKSIFIGQKIRVSSNQDANNPPGLINELKVGIVVREPTIDRQSNSPEDRVFEEDTEAAFELKAAQYSQPIDPFLKESDAPYYSILSACDEAPLETARESLYNSILSLWRQGANAICVNEIGYPAFRFPIHGCEEEKIEALENRNKAMIEADTVFRKKLQAIANGAPIPETGEEAETGQPAIIVAGTYYDAQTVRNNAVLFFPNPTGNNRISPRIHQKLTTAKSKNIREVVRTPPHRKFPIYQTDLGLVAVLVCLDAYDLNMYLRQFQIAQRTGSDIHGPSIIFVPSYSVVPLSAACKDLSNAAAAVVVYSNPAQNGERAEIYICGERTFTRDGIGAHICETMPTKDAINQRRADIIAQRSEILAPLQTLI